MSQIIVNVNVPSLPAEAANDLPRIMRALAEAGLVVLPGKDGKPYAYVIRATPEMTEWVEERIAGEEYPWQE